MLPRYQLAAVVHGRHIQGPGNVPLIVAPHGAGVGSVQNMVVVCFGGCMVSGMEMIRYLMELPDDDGTFEHAVDPPFQGGACHGGGSMKIGGLPHGMNPCIGAA